MPSWPSSLPQAQFIPATDQAQNAVLRTQMDTGPSSRRNRFTAVSRNITVGMMLTVAQRQTFDSFYNTTLKHGALSFDWVDPVGGATVSMVFAEPPKWSSVGGIHWWSDLNLEILP